MKSHFDILDFCLAVFLFTVLFSGGLVFTSDFFGAGTNQAAQVSGGNVRTYAENTGSPASTKGNYQSPSDKTYFTTQTKNYGNTVSPGNTGSPSGNTGVSNVGTYKNGQGGSSGDSKSLPVRKSGVPGVTEKSVVSSTTPSQRQATSSGQTATGSPLVATTTTFGSSTPSTATTTATTASTTPYQGRAVSVDLKIDGSNGPVSISSGLYVTPSWTSTNASYCSPGWSVGREGAYSPGVSIGPVTSGGIYTIRCYGADGKYASDSVTVDLNEVSKVITSPTPGLWQRFLNYFN